MNYLCIYLYTLIALTTVGLYGILSKKTWAKLIISFEILSFSFLALLSLLIMSTTVPSNATLGESIIVFLILLDASVMGVFVASIFAVYRKLNAEKPEVLRKIKG